MLDNITPRSKAPCTSALTATSAWPWAHDASAQGAVGCTTTPRPGAPYPFTTSSHEPLCSVFFLSLLFLFFPHPWCPSNRPSLSPLKSCGSESKIGGSGCPLNPQGILLPFPSFYWLKSLHLIDLDETLVHSFVEMKSGFWCDNVGISVI